MVEGGEVVVALVIVQYIHHSVHRECWVGAFTEQRSDTCEPHGPTPIGREHYTVPFERTAGLRLQALPETMS